MSNKIYCCDVNIITERENITEYSVSEKKIEAKGGNYFSELYSIKIKGKKNGQNKEIDLFIKKLPIVTFEGLSANEAFAKETFVYKTLLPQYEKLQLEANISLKDQLKFAKYYNVNDGSVIIMEDLRKKGFSVYNRFKSIDIEYAEFALGQLAKMHALSFAMEHRKPDLFKYIKENIEGMPLKYTEKILNFLRNQCQSAIDVLDSEDAKTRLSRVIEDKMNILKKAHTNINGRTQCICHNDFKNNNLMYKCDHDGKISELIPLDYQTVCFRYPLNDFFHFVLPASDKSFRAKHMLHLKEFYYNKFSQYLSYYDLDVNDIYPKNLFDEDYDTLIIDRGLIVGLILLTMVLAPEDDFPDLCGGSDNIVPAKTDLYKRRVNELIDDYINWGYL